MDIDAEKNGAKFATDNDPRAFPWGKTLRKYKIDELIQLWNVFKGEMHFVGLRPERDDFGVKGSFGGKNLFPFLIIPKEPFLG